MIGAFQMKPHRICVVVLFAIPLITMNNFMLAFFVPSLFVHLHFRKSNWTILRLEYVINFFQFNKLFSVCVRVNIFCEGSRNDYDYYYYSVYFADWPLLIFIFIFVRLFFNLLLNLYTFGFVWIAPHPQHHWLALIFCDFLRFPFICTILFISSTVRLVGVS